MNKATNEALSKLYKSIDNLEVMRTVTITSIGMKTVVYKKEGFISIDIDNDKWIIFERSADDGYKKDIVFRNKDLICIIEQSKFQ